MVLKKLSVCVCSTGFSRNTRPCRVRKMKVEYFKFAEKQCLWLTVSLYKTDRRISGLRNQQVDRTQHKQAETQNCVYIEKCDIYSGQVVRPDQRVLINQQARDREDRHPIQPAQA